LCDTECRIYHPMRRFGPATVRVGFSIPAHLTPCHLPGEGQLTPAIAVSSSPAPGTGAHAPKMVYRGGCDSRSDDECASPSVAMIGSRSRSTSSIEEGAIR
jgi:hypothetical protein